MAIVLDENFTVRSGPEEAWSFFTDPARVFPCIPSARLVRRVDDRVFEGELGFRLGPFGAKFRGEMEYDELEREKRHIRLSGDAEDTRRDARARLVMDSRLADGDGGTTEVDVRQEIILSGSLSHLAESALARNMADMLFGRFVSCVQDELGG